MASAKRFYYNVALMYLDLDGFKQVNDNFGHGKGDEVLIEVAQRLRRCVREVDTVARLGGDEFVITGIRGLKSLARSYPNDFKSLFWDNTRIPFFTRRVSHEAVYPGAI